MNRKRPLNFSLFVVAAVMLTGCGPEVRVGSKAFTESVILGEIAVLKGTSQQTPVAHLREIGGTQALWRGLLRGDIDAYPDYTGTIAADLLADKNLPQDELARQQAIKKHLGEREVEMTEPLGFSNSYALAMTKQRAEELGIRRISDLRWHGDLRIGMSHEFLKRDDGWWKLREHYRLGIPPQRVQGLDHNLAYQALAKQDIDLIDVSVTDAKVKQFNLVLLEDDEAFFPKYNAVYLYRRDLKARAPQLVAAMENLAGSIDDETMRGLNAKVENEHQAEIIVAKEFLGDSHSATVVAPTFWRRLFRSTRQHLYLVLVSLTAAICVAIPLGIVAAKRPRSEHLILLTAEVIQTIPGLALLVILMFPIGALGDLLGSVGLPRLRTVGPAPAIVALFLYSLLPILRNTHAGLTGIPGNLKESAEALGLSPWAQLTKIELPMASRTILAGVKTTAVINVGYATLGGLIGAGGYGEVIMEGLRKLDFTIMMEGAVPAAVLALGVKSLFEYGERFLVPKGLRLKAAH